MSEPIVFQHQEGSLKLSSVVVETMKKFTQKSLIQCEAGGILLGRFILESNDVIVDEVTTPMASDKRSLFGFFRSEKPHQAILNERWKSSGGTCNYLGEWHTHPQKKPIPSNRDLKSWEEQINRLPEGRNMLFFIIVGTQSISAWQVYRNPFQIKSLVKLEIL